MDWNSFSIHTLTYLQLYYIEESQLVTSRWGNDKKEFLLKSLK